MTGPLRHLMDAAGGAPSGDTLHYSFVMPVVAIFIVLMLGLSGSLIPPLVNVYLPKFNLSERYGFRFFNGLAAGLVLAVGYIHSIPDAVQIFQDAFPEQTQTAQYAWGGFCAMLGSLITFFAEEYVHRNIGRFATVHGADHSHSDDSSKQLEESSDSTVSKDTKIADMAAIAEKEMGYYTELYVLLFGLSFHSIFVGIALGVSNDWGLFAAIVFHQFFEGFALGARVARAGFRSKLHIWFLDLVYATSAPIGIAIGIGIEAAIAHNDVAYNCVDGIFQGLSSGILIYVSLIHMMKEEMDRPEFKKGGSLLVIMYVGFLLGAGFMAVIGIWA